jgi:lipid-A-disaccharide synthase
MGRINTIKRCVTKMVVFFRFEEELYRRHGVDAYLAGHPLVDTVKVTAQKADTLKRHGLSEEGLTVALLPGSRRMEVDVLLPLMLSASKIIRWANDKAQFVVVRHPDLPEGLFAGAVNASRADVRIASGDTYDILAASDLAIVASGTATLETAMIGTPFVIIYKAHLLTYLAYLAVSRTPFLGLVNVIAGKSVVPELLQYNATPRRIAEAALAIMSNDAKRKEMRGALKAVASSLGPPGASLRAARAILPFLS